MWLILKPLNSLQFVSFHPVLRLLRNLCRVLEWWCDFFFMSVRKKFGIMIDTRVRYLKQAWNLMLPVSSALQKH
jgi:hypothetical protein